MALIEGTNLASLDSTGFSDPYVVFTCNGKTRTSSVKLQTSNPQWNGEAFILLYILIHILHCLLVKPFWNYNSDILEFDAMEEPPSVLDLEVFDFDGPFDQATSLGHAEINFLKCTSTELADMWVSLEGKLAQSSQSKLHLRIFLDNNKGVETIKEYLTKMEKEVGKKVKFSYYPYASTHLSTHLSREVGPFYISLPVLHLVNVRIPPLKPAFVFPFKFL